MQLLQTLFSTAEKRYLTADELKQLGRYSLSLPHRLAVYRQIRDQELALLQPVADGLEIALPNAPVAMLERSLKTGIAALRSSAMAMLVNDLSSLDDTLRWVQQGQQHHASEGADQLMFQLMLKQLQTHLKPAHFKLLEPYFAPFQAVGATA